MKPLAFAVPAFMVSCSLAVDVDRFNRGGTVADSAVPVDSGSDDSALPDVADTTAPVDGDTSAETPLGRRPQVFVAGGNEDGINTTNIVRADVLSDGTLGAWTLDASKLPASASTNVALRTASGVYVLGPDFVTTDAVTVRFARVADGKVTDWAGVKTLIPHSRLAAATNGKFLYAMGGLRQLSGIDTPQTSVYFAPLGSDGTPGAFAATTSLPVARDSGCGVFLENAVYHIAGDGGGGGQRAVYRAEIKPDGSLDAWAKLADLSFGVTGCTAVAVGKRIFVLGGYGAQDTVQHALVGSDGSISAWVTAAAKMPAKHAFSQAVVVGGYVIVPGGFTSASARGVEVDIAAITESGIGTWRATTPLPKPRAFLTAFGVD